MPLRIQLATTNISEYLHVQLDNLPYYRSELFTKTITTQQAACIDSKVPRFLSNVHFMHEYIIYLYLNLDVKYSTDTPASMISITTVHFQPSD